MVYRNSEATFKRKNISTLWPRAKKIGAFCLSEPEAGSDATSQSTTAIDCGDHYVINGTKNWITNGNSASTYLVIAQTDPEKGHHGINVLIVERDMPGFIVGAKEDKLGIRGSDTHTLMFQDVKVPKENRIGADGFGFKFAMKTLAGGTDWYRCTGSWHCFGSVRVVSGLLQGAHDFR